MGYKRFVFLLLVLLLLYLSLYTWNLKTGVIDRLTAHTGLEAVGLVLKPGHWVREQSVNFWERYVYLVGLRQENERLKQYVEKLTFENVRLREEAAKAERLEKLLLFNAPPEWRMEGARVLAQQLGPVGSLETILVDKGRASGVGIDSPVITPDGVAGRILKAGSYSSTVLLVTDANSRIAVMGRSSGTTGILAGQGPSQPLSVYYVPLNAAMDVDEVLVTSGLAGIYPRGVPVARVTRVERSEVSLFKSVQAVPLAALRDMEEVLVLRTSEPPRRLGLGGR